MDKKSDRQNKTAQGYQKINKTVQDVQKRADEPRTKHAAKKTAKNTTKKA